MWLMLVNSVFGENKTARMRIWRALKGSWAALAPMAKGAMA